MIVLLKKIIANNLIIKIFALIIGYSLWSFLGSVYVQTTTIQVPVCFYNVPENKEIVAQPESVSIQLRGKRADLKQCSDLALHLNAESLSCGQHTIAPCEEQLFLPKTISMVNYKPLTISLLIKEKTA